MNPERPAPSEGQPISRRDLTRLLGAAGLAGAFGAPWLLSAVASAQPKQPTRQDPKKAIPAAAGGNKTPSILDGIIKPGRERSWTFKVALRLSSYQQELSQTPKDSMPKIIPFKFTTAAMVFPILESTAGSSCEPKNLVSKLRWDGNTLDIKPEVSAAYAAGTKLARWHMKDLAGRTLDLDLDIPMDTWEVVFDEAKAAKAVWPTGNKWGRIAQSTFGTQMGVEASSPVVAEAVRQWTAGKPPQSIPPLQLAKFLAGKVLETVQPSGDGLVSSRSGLLQGFDIRGAEATLKSAPPRGSEHDIACVLCAVYRNAGLPARTVIGYDVTKSKGEDSGLKRSKGGDDIRSWVEFCLYDETTNTEVWVPVDIMRQRKSGTKPPPLDKPWKFFGHNEDLDDVMPISFQYHPPTTVVAHGSPCFWGWLTTPELQVAEQTLRFQCITTPKRGGDKDKDKKGPYGK